MSLNAVKIDARDLPIFLCASIILLLSKTIHLLETIHSLRILNMITFPYLFLISRYAGFLVRQGNCY